jgi:hypothetical protein
MKAYEGVEVKLHSFFTLAPDQDVVSFTSNPLYIRGKKTPVPLEQSDRQAKGPVWTLRQDTHILPLPGFKPRL